MLLLHFVICTIANRDDLTHRKVPRKPRPSGRGQGAQYHETTLPESPFDMLRAVSSVERLRPFGRRASLIRSGLSNSRKDILLVSFAQWASLRPMAGELLEVISDDATMPVKITTGCFPVLVNHNRNPLIDCIAEQCCCR